MKKKPDKLLVLLLNIAENLKECGEQFYAYKIESPNDLRGFSDRIKEIEKNCDNLVHELIVALNGAFITPIEHEDILSLAERMDEVVDCMEESAIYQDMFNLYQEDEYIKQFKKNLALATKELHISVEFLANRKLSEIRPHTVNVKSYEEVCDSVERMAIRRLFEDYRDNAVKIIELKDMYQLLENTMDNCQLVAKSLDAIVMKNM